MPPIPQPISPYVKIILYGGAIISVVVVALIFRHPSAAYSLADLKPSLNPLKYHQPELQPMARPTAAATAVIRQVAAPAKPPPPPCQPCIAKAARYKLAIETGMGPEPERNSYEIPKMVAMSPPANRPQPAISQPLYPQ